MKSYPLVLVDWIDPHSDAGWKDPHEIEETYAKDFSCKTVGWLLREDAKKVMIASSLTAEQIGDLFVIPRRCIDSITPLNADSTVPLPTKAAKPRRAS